VATVSIDVPNTLVPVLSKALALAMREPEPTTNTQRLDLAQRFMKQQAKQALLDYRAQEAAERSRTDDADGAVSW
jgi:hypothetical protein